jgi:hypothetical protein
MPQIKMSSRARAYVEFGAAQERHKFRKMLLDRLFSVNVTVEQMTVLSELYKALQD